MNDTGASIESQSDFPQNARGLAQYWKTEFVAARKFCKKFWDSASISVEKFLDSREGDVPDGQMRPDDQKRSSVNFYWANVVTQRALLYGRVPQVDVKRRYDDEDDDAARVAGPVILQRLLNTDIERGDDGYKLALRHALSDYLIVGYAFAKVRYVCEFEDYEKDAILGDDGSERAPKVSGKRKAVDDNGVPREDVVTDYIHWRDQLWSPCRIPEDRRWWAFSTPMTRDEIEKRWGADKARNAKYGIKLIETGSSASGAAGESPESPRRVDPWSRALVWEVWSKERGDVTWLVEGMDEVLETCPDPYRLRGFWPFPEPIMANVTTDALIPRPDYAMAQDLYNDLNELSTRIWLLERALKVAGVYDRTADGLERLLSEGYENLLLPVDKWATFKEKGGMNGVIEWMPLEQIVNALAQLRDQRSETKQLLYEITGWSDLMRGQVEDGSESARSASGRIRFASARLQHRQDEFAAFASRLQQLRAELIGCLFDPETIKARSNVMRTQDAAVADQAVALIKEEWPHYRVEVLPEALAQQDFASLKNDRIEVLDALSKFAAAFAPLIQQLGPASVPLAGKVVKWTLSGLRGAAGIEGEFDKATQQAEAAAQQAQQAQQQGGGQPPPDPKLQGIQAKSMADQQKMMLQSRLDQQRMQNETVELARRQQAQTSANVQETMAEERVKLQSEMAREAVRARTQAAQVAAGPVAPQLGAPGRRRSRR